MAKVASRSPSDQLLQMFRVVALPFGHVTHFTPSRKPPRLFSQDSFFGHGFQAGQPLFKLAAAHLVEVHEQAEHFAHETAFTGHAPRHDCLTALGPEREFRRVGGLHRLLKIEPEMDQPAGLAFRDGHFARADLFAAFPGHRRARAGVRAGEGVFCVRVELGPRRPRLPLVQVVDVRKNLFRRGGNIGGTHDGEFIRSPGDDDDENDGDKGER